MVEIEKKKVLLVDDVEFIVDVMASYLKNSPVSTFRANNGKTAIDMALLPSFSLRLICSGYRQSGNGE